MFSSGEMNVCITSFQQFIYVCLLSLWSSPQVSNHQRLFKAQFRILPRIKNMLQQVFRLRNSSFTSWYFLVTLAGTHWQSKQRWEQQAQFPPQRFTRRQLGQKMASVLASSSRSDTEKLRGVQLYSRTSSLSRLRSTPPERQKARRQKRIKRAFTSQHKIRSTFGFFIKDEGFSQHVPRRCVQLLHVHLPSLRLKVLHHLLHGTQPGNGLWQILNALLGLRDNCREFGFWHGLWR